MTWDDAAAQVMRRIETLAMLSEEPGCLTRPAFSTAMRQANATVADWMQQAGMSVIQDAMGNLSGRYAGEEGNAATFILGSHLDTVRNAGKYDGMLGILVALACIERLHERGIRLPFALEMIAFADEEGLRYNTAYLGSQAVVGTFDPRCLQLVDGAGISLAEALRAFGGDPDRLATARKDPQTLLGYCEVHIEQGPVLEAENLPVGVVTAIAGQSRIQVRFTGQAGHAGTVPMHLRSDALCAAAEFVLAVETYARSQPGLVATVGQLTPEPGVSNVIPGVVALSLDVRHQADAERERAGSLLHSRAEQIAAARNLTLTWTVGQDNRATSCSPRLGGLLAQAIAAAGQRVYHLPSGAGHDAVVMAKVTEIAMLFVRCKDGISHHPAEAVAEADVAVALEVLERFVTMLPHRMMPKRHEDVS